MKKLIKCASFLTLTLILGSNIALASVVQDPKVLEKVCSFGTTDIPNDDTTTDDENEAQLVTREFIEKMEEQIESNTKACGTPNGHTKSLEKGDCVLEEKIITEIVEPVGPAVQLGDNEVIDVYTGICALTVHTGEDQTDGYCQTGDSSLLEKDTADIDGDENVTELLIPDCSYATETRTLTYTNYSDCNDNAAYCEHHQWVISSTGAGLIKLYVKQMYIFGAGIVGFIAVIIIIYSGIQISVSGVSGDITASKDRIIQAISGIVLLFLSGLILYTINPTFFS